MPVRTSVAETGGFRLERRTDLGDQCVGHLLLALAPHHRPQLGFEVVGLGAGLALIQVALDGDTPVLGELAIEEALQLVECVLAIRHGRRPERVV